MPAEADKEAIRAFYDAISRREIGGLSPCCHENLVFYHEVDTPHLGVEGFIVLETKNFDAFEDWQMPIRDMVFEGERCGLSGVRRQRSSSNRTFRRRMESRFLTRSGPFNLPLLAGSDHRLRLYAGPQGFRQSHKPG